MQYNTKYSPIGVIALLVLCLKQYSFNICSFLCCACIQLKQQLSECQSQLDVVQKEAQAHKEELKQVT